MGVHQKTPRLPAPGEGAGGTFWGRAACVLGILSAVAGGFLFLDFTLELLGVLLGTTGYLLGARRLGTATVILPTFLPLVFMAASQGEIPGLGPTDPLALPDP